MPLVKEKLALATKATAAAVVAYWISIPAALQTLIIFMSVDFVTGIAVAVRQKKVESGYLVKGITKKVGIFAMVFMAHPLEELLSREFGLSVEMGLEKWFAVAYTLGEAISIIENCYHVGVPIPAFVVEVLLKAKKTIRWADDAQLEELNSAAPVVAETPRPLSPNK